MPEAVVRVTNDIRDFSLVLQPIAMKYFFDESIVDQTPNHAVIHKISRVHFANARIIRSHKALQIFHPSTAG